MNTEASVAQESSEQGVNMSVLEKVEKVNSRIHRGPYDEYELEETLCRNQDGTYQLHRSFAGEYSELNLIRAEWVRDNDGETISAEEAKKWLEKAENVNQASATRRDPFEIGLHFAIDCHHEEEYDGVWFKAFLDNHFSKACFAEISFGYCLYNKEGHFWDQMSDVMPYEEVKVTMNTSTELYDELTAILDKIHKTHFFRETTAYIDRITLYDHEYHELGSIENNELGRIYRELADMTEEYDVMGWN